MELAAADSTGIDTVRASRYFLIRRHHVSKDPRLIAYRRYPKLEMICDCSSHLILSANAVAGPSGDANTLRRLLFAGLRRASIDTLLADAGYDSEANHCFARDGCRVRSVIPPLCGRGGRRVDHRPTTRHRARMWLYRDWRYGQRWQAEATISMIKRNLGSCVAARSMSAQCKETMLKALTHNIMLIVACLLTFSTEQLRRRFVSSRRLCHVRDCL